MGYLNEHITPTGYRLGGTPTNENPFWGDGGGNTKNITATASVDNTTGTPAVEVTKTETTEAVNFDFAFSHLKGEQGEPGEKGDDGSTPVVTASATVTSSGTTGVTVIKSGTTEAPHFDFEFTGIGGGGGSADADYYVYFDMVTTNDSSFGDQLKEWISKVLYEVEDYFDGDSYNLEIPIKFEAPAQFVVKQGAAGKLNIVYNRTAIYEGNNGLEFVDPAECPNGANIDQVYNTRGATSLESLFGEGCLYVTYSGSGDRTATLNLNIPIYYGGDIKITAAFTYSGGSISSIMSSLTSSGNGDNKCEVRIFDPRGEVSSTAIGNFTVSGNDIYTLTYGTMAMFGYNYDLNALFSFLNQTGGSGNRLYFPRFNRFFATGMH